MFEKCKQVYEWELLEDPVIKRHFTYLYNTLLEDNLKKIIEFTFRDFDNLCLEDA